MKIFICIFFFLQLGVLSAQNELSEDNAKIILGEFFKGLENGDTLAMSRVISPNLQMQTVYLSKDGENKVSFSRGSDFVTMIANRPVDQVWKEEIESYSVFSDGNLATVWTPYKFYLNGKFSHCGANSFTLVYTDNGWQIFNIIDSRRIGSCGE